MDVEVPGNQMKDTLLDAGVDADVAHQLMRAIMKRKPKKKLQSGTTYHYILILLLSTTLFVTGFFFMDSLAGVDLRLFVVFVLSVFVFSH